MNAVPHTVSRPFWQNTLLDCLALLAPLGVLVLVIYRTLATSVLVFPDPSSPPYNTGDYYRYVNMALPNGDPRYVFHQPFLYRILVPGTVHLLSMIGLPFRTGFFSITVISLTISTIGIFFLVRGIGLGRGTAMGAALVYVTLQWAVAYNVRDYFLVDPAAHAFFVMILLAGQRRQRALVVVLATIGVVCKESIYLPIVFTVVQWLIPSLRPLSARLGELAKGRVLAVIQRVPRTTWGWVAALVLFPVTATQIVQHVIPLYYAPLSLLHVWRVEIPKHFQHHKLLGLYDTVSRSTWGTFGVFFALCVLALLTRRWRQTGWSGWALVAASIIITYSYAVSGDAERLSINAWPFIIVLGAVMIDSLSKALRVSAALLWSVALLAQFLYEPLIGPPGPGILGPLAPVAQIVGLPLMATVSLVAIVLTYLNYRKVLTLPALALAGVLPGSATDMLEVHTQKMPLRTTSAEGQRAHLQVDYAAHQPISAIFMLTIIIPAYNEEKRLPGTLRTIYQYLAGRGELDHTEVIVVDDGSKDQTAEIVRSVAQSWPQLRLVAFAHNQGKGAAVKAGVTASQGNRIFFCDADLSTPIDELPKFLPPSGPHAEVVIGSRELKGARRINEPFYRHVMGRVFNLLVQMLVIKGISDTQCGFKCLTGSAARVLCSQQELSGMSFDVELLALAQAMGMSIAEVPVLWRHEQNSRVRPVQDTFMMFRDILRLRQRMRHFDPSSIMIASEDQETVKRRALTK